MASSPLRIGFLGAGKIAQAMAKGFISAGLTKAEAIIASDPFEISRAVFESYGAKTVADNPPVVERSDVVLISVKPNIVEKALKDVRGLAEEKLFISIAMGITLEQLEGWLPKSSRVIRVMPNTPALVQAGASGFIRGKMATDVDASLTKSLFGSIGICEEIDSEYLMDAVTALSGSGPAYIFVLIEALADGGVKMGLSRPMAYKFAAQTVFGAAKLVLESGEHPGKLKDDVTSPAGSTASGLQFLEQNAFRHTVAGAVEAATRRCREISGNK